MGAMEALAALVAVLGRIGALDDLIAPASEVGPVGARHADEMGDDVDGDRCDELGDELTVAALEDGIEVLVAQVADERLDPHRLVVGDGRIDDLADLTVTRLGDLVDELLVLGHHHTGFAERRHERVDELGGLEHLGLAREEPAGVDAGHWAAVADLGEQLVRNLVARGERVELDIDGGHGSPSRPER